MSLIDNAVIPVYDDDVGFKHNRKDEQIIAAAVAKATQLSPDSIAKTDGLIHCKGSNGSL